MRSKKAAKIHFKHESGIKTTLKHQIFKMFINENGLESKNKKIHNIKNCSEKYTKCIKLRIEIEIY